MAAIVSALKGVLSSLFGSRKRILIPFLVAAFAELLLIGVLWLAPQAPFSKLLVPPIKYFYGERVVHYPWHIWFLYYAMKHTYVAAALVIGAFMSGVACAMVRQDAERQPVSMRSVLASKQVRYRTVVWLWLCIWAMGKLLGEGLGRAHFASAAVSFGVGVIATVLLQMLLAYAIPLAVFQRTGWVRALTGSVREALRYPFSTLLVIAVPSAVVIAFSVLAHPTMVMEWSKDTRPELALAFAGGRLVLWTLADAMLTIGIASLWWAHHGTLGAHATTSTASASQEGPARA